MDWRLRGWRRGRVERRIRDLRLELNRLRIERDDGGRPISSDRWFWLGNRIDEAYEEIVRLNDKRLALS